MKTIYKYPLNIVRFQYFSATGLKPLCVQTQFEQPCLWAEIDTEQPLVQIVVDIYGTGEQLDPDPGKYFGTFQQFGGQFIGHVYIKDAT